jgi:hypothetical protein
MALQHQSLSDQHFTPPAIIEACREVMGGIDLDPCTSDEVNQWSIRAKTAFMSDGLEKLDQHLKANSGLKVWCNPPGGKTKNQSNTKLWLEAIAKHHQEGTIEQAFFLLFNREFLGHPCLCSIPRLNFAERVKYWGWDETQNIFREGNWKAIAKGEDLVAITKGLHYWHGISSTTKANLYTAATKEEVIHWLKARKFGTKEWTNSPTQQSTLLYFPPKNDWSDRLIETFQSHGFTDYWIIPK